MELGFDQEEEGAVVCETCGTELYGFLDGCPYCDDQDVTAPCPSCGAEIYDGSEQCPACGDWIVMKAGSGGSRRIWIIAVVAVIVVFTLAALKLHG